MRFGLRPGVLREVMRRRMWLVLHLLSPFRGVPRGLVRRGHLAGERANRLIDLVEWEPTEVEDPQQFIDPSLLETAQPSHDLGGRVPNSAHPAPSMVEALAWRGSRRTFSW